MKQFGLAIGIAERGPKGRGMSHDDTVHVAVQVIHEHRVTHGLRSGKPPAHVLDAVHVVIDAGAYVQAGNQITEWIIDLKKSGHARNPNRSWGRHKNPELQIYLRG